jgi:pimeloyl-ACP methyl ester carboxylesterase
MKLNFKKIGSGPPLVILHGLFGSADNWYSISRELDKEFTMYLVDQRNHGDSPHSDEWNYEVMAADLLELLDEEGLDKVFLMGHSMGGKVAMTFAVNNPERVARLIVADISPRYYPVHHEVILDGLQAINLTEIQSRKEADDALAVHIPDFGTRQFLLKSLGRNADGFYWKINLPVIVANIEEVGKALEDDVVYEGETLFLAGAKSNYIQEKDMESILEHFPNYQLKIIPNAGHWLHAEQPKAVVEEIRSFLR